MKMRAYLSALLIAASTYLLSLCVMLFILPLEGHQAFAAQRWRVASRSSSSPALCGSPRPALALGPKSSPGFPQDVPSKKGFQALDFPRGAPARATLGAAGRRAQSATVTRAGVRALNELPPTDVATATPTSIAPVALSQARNTSGCGYQQVPGARRAPS